MIEIVARASHDVDGLALIDARDQVWRTFARPWWDVASWLWFWLAPGARRWVLVRDASGKRVRVRAFRVAKRHVRIGRSA